MEAIRIPFRATLIAGALAASAGLVGNARALEGYVVDRTGDVIHTRTGDCLRSGLWTANDAVPQCNPEIVAQVSPGLVPDEVTAQPAEQEGMRRISLETDTTFGFDSAELTDQGKEILDQLVQTSEGTEQARINIVGYADRIGPEGYNEDLSRRRAEAVKEYVVTQGMAEDRVTIAALGESNPVVQCEGVSGEELINCLRPNRRTEIEFAAFEPAGQVEQAPPQTIERQPEQPAIEERESALEGMPPPPTGTPQELQERSGTLTY